MVGAPCRQPAVGAVPDVDFYAYGAWNIAGDEVRVRSFQTRQSLGHCWASDTSLRRVELTRAADDSRMFVNYPLRTASSHYFNMSAGLRRTHIRRRAPGEEIFTRRREDVNDLRVLGEETFVVDVAGNHSNIARDH